MIDDNKPSLEAVLEHHGVKGMKWGVRKSEVSGSSNPVGKAKAPRTGMSERHKQIAKEVAIGAGVLAVVAGAAFVSYKLNQSGSLRLGDISKLANNKTTLDAAHKVLKEPTDVIHLARGKNKGLTFLRKGNTPDYFSVFDKLGMNADGLPREFLEKASDNSGHLISTFLDPRGYTDFAGRPIAHDLVIPRNMADGIHSVDDVKAKIWPMLKDTYDAFYADSLKPNI